MYRRSICALYCWVVFCGTLGHVQVSQARRDGAPVCTMLPGHGSSNGAYSSKFAVSSSLTSVRAGENTTITIIALEDNIPFLGYVVSVFDGDSETRVGTFASTIGTNISPCTGATAATHSENGAKNKVNLVWTAPSNPSGSNYTIKAAIVPELSSYWVSIFELYHATATVPPEAPVGELRLLNATSSHLTASWQSISVANSGTPIHTYEIWTATAADSSNYILGCQYTLSGSELGTQSCVVDDLQTDTEYHAYLVAINSHGRSLPGSKMKFATLAATTTNPSPPTLDSVSLQDSTTINVQWSAAPEYVLGMNDSGVSAYITYYRVEYRVKRSQQWQRDTVSLNSSPGIVLDGKVVQPKNQVTIKGLLPRSEYEVRVVAGSFLGESIESNVVEIVTSALERTECTTECRIAGGECHNGACLCPVTIENTLSNQVHLGPMCRDRATTVCLDPKSMFCISWIFRVDEEHQVKVIDLVMRAQTTGWLGLIFDAKDRRMQGADVILGWVDDTSGKVSVLDMYSSSTGITPVLDELVANYEPQQSAGQSNFIQVAGTQDDVFTTLMITRQVTTSDTLLDFQFLVNSAPIPVSWALSKDNSDDYLLGHDTTSKTRGVSLVDFSNTPESISSVTDTTNLGTKRQNMIIAHGILMWLAWGLFFPTGSCIAYRAKALFVSSQQTTLQRKKSVFPSKKPRGKTKFVEDVRVKPNIKTTRYFPNYPTLFKLHRACQVMGVLLSIVGFMMLVLAPDRGFGSNSLATSTFHTQIGLSLLGGSLLQGFIGIVFHGDQAHKVHQWLGPTLLAVAYIKQIPTGVNLAGSTTLSSALVFVAPTTFVLFTLIGSKPRVVTMFRILASTTKTFAQNLTWKGASAAIDRYIAKKCYLLGSFVATRPYFTIAFSLFICLLCCLGILRMEMLTGAEDLYVPQGTKALDELDVFQDHFAQIGSDVIDVQLFSKSKKNLLTKETVALLVDLQNSIENITFTDNGETYVFGDICSTTWSTSGCIVSSPTLFWKNSIHILELDTDIFETVSYNLTVDPLGTRMKKEKVLGGIKYSDTETTSSGNPKITHVDSFRMAFPLTPLGWDFQAEVIAYLESTAIADEDLEMVFFVTRGKSSELDKAISGDTLLFVLAIATMVVFAVNSLGEADAVTGKSALAASGVTSVILAIGAGFGVSVVLGFPFTSIHSVLPFLIIGIGLDDMYVIVAGLQEAKAKHKLAIDAGACEMPRGIEYLLPLESRCPPDSNQRLIALGLATSGPSVWMTSLTDFAAFIMGLASLMPAVRSFCGFAAICVMTDMAMQLTFFVAFMSFDLSREQKSKCDVLCCISTRNEASIGVEPTSSSAPKSPSTFQRKTTMKDLEEGLSLENAHPILFRRLLLLFNPMPKIITMVLYFALFIVLGLQSLNIKSYMDEWALYRDDSFLVKWNQNNLRYFEGSGSESMLMITLDLYYEEPDTQAKLLLLGDKFAENMNEPEDSLTSWISMFVTWADRAVPSMLEDHRITVNGKEYTYRVVQKNAFYPLLTKYLSQPIVGDIALKFINLKCAAVDETDGDNPYCKIDSSTLVLSATPVANSDESIVRMQNSRTVCDAAGMPSEKCSPFLSSSAIAELYLGVPREVIVCMGGALGAVGAISLISLSHPFAGVICTVSILVIDIEALGLMYLMGVTLNAVSLVCLVMSVGITFDYIGHITHAFMHSHAEKRATRVVEAYLSVGSSIFRSAFSTFLGVLFLGLASADIFRTMFIIFSSVIMLASAHSFLFVPVILSMIGPSAPHHEEEHDLGPDFVRIEEEIDALIEDVATQSENPILVAPLKPKHVPTYRTACMSCRLTWLVLMTTILFVFAFRGAPEGDPAEHVMSSIATDAVPVEFDLSLTIPRVDVPVEKTSYFCSGFVIPTDTTYHLTEVHPIVENPEVVHHIVLFACVHPYPEKPKMCGAMPDDCLELVATWAVGMGPVIFPDHAGIPMGRLTGNIHMAMQMHYDNFRNTPGIVDRSGLRLRLSRVPREHDLSVLTIGANLPMLQLPPQQQDTHIVSRCPPTPTMRDPAANEDSLALYVGPGRSIVALSVFLHMHQYGREGEILVHRPDGTRRLEMFRNTAYNFDFQRFEDVTPVELYSNDTLYLHCTFDTSATPNVVEGGDATENEMCLAFILIYEKSKIAESRPVLSLCTSDSLGQDLPADLQQLAYAD